MKYDWSKLHRKFITGEYTTLKQFADKESIPYRTLKERAVGWTSEKQAKDKLKSDQITQKVIERQIISASDINNRHLTLYNKALDLLEQLLDNEAMGDDGTINTYQLGEVLNDLRITQRGQRLALGMDRDGGNQAAEDNVTKVFGDMRRAFEDEQDED